MKLKLIITFAFLLTVVSSHPVYIVLFDKSFSVADFDNNKTLNLSTYGKIKQRFNNDLFQGVVITINNVDESILETLRKESGVLGVWESKKYKPHQFQVHSIHDLHKRPDAIQTLTTKLHERTGLDRAKEELIRRFASNPHSNVSESQIKVGLIDTGIDYTHPELGGCFGSNCRVRYGYDFGDEDDDPKDCSGHGTHVAGIIGAEKLGITNQVVFGAYKVFSCNPNDTDANSVSLIRAIERAWSDNMDVVNMSVGNNNVWEDSVEAFVAGELANRGVIVVASQGNEGSIGLWSASSPAIHPNVISVGSTDNPIYVGGKLTFQDFFFPYTGIIHSNVPVDANLSVKLITEYNLCDENNIPPFLNVPSYHQVLIVKRGGCTVIAKSKLAKKLGAILVIVANDREGPFVFANEPSEEAVDAISISEDHWLQLIERLKTQSIPDVKISKELDTFRQPIQVSNFSSWGPTVDFRVKPDIVAPGGFIYSTFPTNKQSYAVISGTSMAAPYVAGCVALLKQYFYKWLTPSRAKGLLQAVSSPLLNYRHYPLNYASAFIQGAGLLNVYKAILMANGSYNNDQLDNYVIRWENSKTQFPLNDHFSIDGNYTIGHFEWLPFEFVDLLSSKDNFVSSNATCAPVIQVFKKPSTAKYYLTQQGFKESCFGFFSGRVTASLTKDDPSSRSISKLIYGIYGDTRRVSILNQDKGVARIVNIPLANSSQKENNRTILTQVKWTQNIPSSRIFVELTQPSESPLTTTGSNQTIKFRVCSKKFVPKTQSTTVDYHNCEKNISLTKEQYEYMTHKAPIISIIAERPEWLGEPKYETIRLQTQAG